MPVNQTPCRVTSWVGRTLRRSAACTVVGLLMALGSGCGEPVVGGSGRLVPGKAGAPDKLILTGSPYEMGWWHGKLLGRRIRALHETWQRLAIGRSVGATGDLSRSAAGDIRESIDLFLDIALDRLPETARQELDGMAAATGMSASELLFTEVMRDGLRVQIKNLEPRLPGGIAAVDGPVEGRIVWTGPDAALLADAMIVIQRVPDEGTASVSVAWPGALGAIAALSAKRVAVLACEAMVDKDMRGFGRGVPFTIAARTAIELHTEIEEIRATMGGTGGHSLLLMQDPRMNSEESRSAVGSVEAYRGVQPELEIDELGYVILGAQQELRAGLVRLGLDEKPDDATGLRERVLGAAEQLAGDAAEAQALRRVVLAEARVIWGADRTITLEARRLRSSEPCTVVLQGDGTFR